jgi:hypothetical protein
LGVTIVGDIDGSELINAGASVIISAGLKRILGVFDGGGVGKSAGNMSVGDSLGIVSAVIVDGK